MSAIATAFGPNAPDAFASTRDNYERFAFLLIRAGRVPELELAHLDFRVLLFLLGQKPSHYAAHHRTIAEACDSNATSIKQSLARLRAAGLVLWELVPPHHRLPSGRFTRTNVNRYWVHLPRLAKLLELPATPPASGRKSAASTRPDPASSYGTKIQNEQKPPSSPPPRVEATSSKPRPVEGEAVSPIVEDVGSELVSIREAWEKLGLGPLDPRSVRALENRRAEGATFEQLEAAVVGAGADDWIRRRAKVPFAVVFTSLASIERFAHEGRKILDARVLAARRAADEARRDREWRAQHRSIVRADRPPPTEELRAWLPEGLPPSLPARPMTAEELVKRRAEQLARAEAWARENGVE